MPMTQLQETGKNLSKCESARDRIPLRNARGQDQRPRGKRANPRLFFHAEQGFPAEKNSGHDRLRAAGHLQSMGAHTAPFFFKGGKTGVLLIHGFTGTPWSMRELGVLLSSAGMTVMAPLLPGHGTTPRDLIGIRWEQWVESLQHARDRLAGQCDSIFAAGLSMGGALAYALAARSRLKGVVSMATPMRLERPGIRLVPLVIPFVRYWKKKKGAHLSDEGLQIAYDRYPLAGVLEFQKLLADMRARLPEVTCPALILHAKGDPTVSFENAARIEAAVGSHDKRRILLDDPCHIITHGADRHRVESEVLDFIQRILKSKGTKERTSFAFRGF